MGDADDHAAVVVELELGADLRVLELGELGVLDREEGILREDILDLSLEQGRPAEQAGIVEAHDVHRLIGPITQLEKRRA